MQQINDHINKSKNSGDNKYLTFVLKDETYAVNILHVKEIIEYGGLTHIPMMPIFIRGVLNLRGDAIPVIDLTARFTKEVTEVTRYTCIIIVEVSGTSSQMEIGIKADMVNEVVDITEDQLEPSPKLGSKINTAFIEAIGKINNNFVLILDMDNLLDMEQLAMLEEMVQMNREEENSDKESLREEEGILAESSGEA